MRVPFIDLKAQYNDVAAEIDRTVHEVISTGAYVMGPHNKALESEIATYHGCKHGIGLNSGTDALRIMLDALEIKHGDEVITTAFTFVASAETIVQSGAAPVFVDISRDDFHIDTSKIEAAITSRTKAIMPIHLFGQLCDVDTIGEIAKRHNLIFLEDAAQAIGSKHDDKFAGSFGAAAGFSFYVTKNLGAAGDAGMILTNDDEVADRCRSIRIHGMGRERYYYDYVGYTSRLDEVQAAVLRAKLTRLNEWNEARWRHAHAYARILQDSPLQLPLVGLGNNHTFHQYTVQTPRRDELQAYLKEREIDSMIYYPVPLHYHKPYAAYGKGQGSLPETERTCLEVLSLPIHSHLTEEQVTFAAESVRDFFSKTP